MLDEFNKWIKLNHNKEKTIVTYITRIGLYYKHCNGNINQDTLDKYLNHLKDINVSTNTYNLFIISMKKFIKFYDMDLKLPKTQKPPKKIIEYITYKTLQEIIKQTSLFFLNYNKVDLILMLLFFTGMRKGELLNLKREDIDFEEESFTVTTSKSLPRKIPFLNKRLTKKIQHFFKTNKEKQNAFNINEIHINYCIKKINNEFRLSIKNLTPHVFRGSFAKYCNDIGFSIEDIRYMLGHTKIEQTAQYIQADARAVFKKAKELKL